MNKNPGTKPGLRWSVIVACIALVLLVVAAYLMFKAGNFVSDKVAYVSSSLADRSGISIFLVKGLVFILTIPFFVAVASCITTKNVFGLIKYTMPATDPLSIYRKKAGWVVVGYFGLFWIAMWGASRDAIAYKFCAKTPEGLVTSDGPGKDPIYGIAYVPCTPEDAKVYRAQHGHLLAAHEVQVVKGHPLQWFDSATGQPRIWYVRREDGFHFFDRAGNDPETGEPLAPIASRIVSAYLAERRSMQQQQAGIQQKQAEESQKQRQAEDDTADADQAQELLTSHNYKAAFEKCAHVLNHGANGSCTEVKHEASIGMAHDLVDQAQSDLQRARFDDAIRVAEQAKRLDPDNEPAKHVATVALAMKKKASLDE